MPSAPTLTRPPVSFEIPVVNNMPRDLVVRPAPSTAVATAVGQAITAAHTEGRPLSCLEMLTADQRRAVMDSTEQLLDYFLGNTAAMGTFGYDALGPINSLAERLLKHEDVDLPEVDVLLREMTVKMESIKRRTNLEDPGVMAFYRKVHSIHQRLARLAHLGRDAATVLRIQIMSFNSLLSHAEAELDRQMEALNKAIAEFDVMLERNDDLVFDVKVVIARMEAVKQLAAERAGKIKYDHTDPSDPKAREVRALTTVINSMTDRVGEFSNRLLIAWSTTTEITLARDTLLGMVFKIGVLRYITIPTIRLTIAKWVRMRRGQMAAAIAQVIAEFSQRVMMEYARDAGVALVATEVAARRPTCGPDLIYALANMCSQAAAGISAAREDGARLHNANLTAIRDVMPTIAGVTAKLSDEAIARVVAVGNSELPQSLAVSHSAQAPTLVLER